MSLSRMLIWALVCDLPHAPEPWLSVLWLETPHPTPYTPNSGCDVTFPWACFSSHSLALHKHSHLNPCIGMSWAPVYCIPTSATHQRPRDTMGPSQPHCHYSHFLMLLHSIFYLSVQIPSE